MMKLRDIVTLMQETYCGNVGIEYMHVEDFTTRRWLRDRIEAGRLRKDNLSNAEKKRVLSHLPRGRTLREIPPHPLCRPEALLARGR